VWDSWQRAPDAARWGLLSRWRDPAELAEAACAAALAQQRAQPARRSPVAAFCVAHALAPADPGQRAVFFLLTGQHAQHRAADPDGSATARAYAAADEQARSAMRAAVAAAGDLDLARNIVGTGRRRQLLEPEEREYLAGQCAGRRDWAALWDVVRDMPVAEAARWRPSLGDGWRPANRDAALFDLLRRADPQRVGQGRDALSPCPRRIETSYRLPAGAAAVALSDDGRRVAVAGSLPGQLGVVTKRKRVCEFDVPSGEMKRERIVSVSTLAHFWLCYAGGDLAVRADAPEDRRSSQLFRGSELFRLDGGSLTTFRGEVDSTPEGMYPLASPRGGFAVTWRGSPTLQRVNGASVMDWNSFLTLHQPGGSIDGDIDFWPDGPGMTGVPAYVASGPGGLLGVIDANSFAVYDTRDCRRPRVIGRHQLERNRFFPMLCFAGPDRVIVVERRRLSGWRVGPSGLEREALSEPGIVDSRSPGSAVAVQLGDIIAVRTPDFSVAFLDARTLSPLAVPGWVPGGFVRQLWNCPDGAYWATLSREDMLAPQHVITVLRDPPPVAEVADRVPAQWVPADIATVTSALADPTLPPAARPLVELLHDCLRWRLGGEIRIGQSDSLPPPGTLSHDDVALSPVTPRTPGGDAAVGR
jgi:hypothetical protein